jgi:hypothetical protein
MTTISAIEFPPVGFRKIFTATGLQDPLFFKRDFHTTFSLKPLHQTSDTRWTMWFLLLQKEEIEAKIAAGEAVDRTNLPFSGHGGYSNVPISDFFTPSPDTTYVSGGTGEVSRQLKKGVTGIVLEIHAIPSSSRIVLEVNTDQPT